MDPPTTGSPRHAEREGAQPSHNPYSSKSTTGSW